MQVDKEGMWIQEQALEDEESKEIGKTCKSCQVKYEVGVKGILETQGRKETVVHQDLKKKKTKLLDVEQDERIHFDLVNSHFGGAVRIKTKNPIVLS